MTTFHEIYDLFLSDVIDSYFIDYELGTVDFKELEHILLAAVVRFKHPKKNLNEYDLNFCDEEEVRGCFSEELTYEEQEILVSFMGIKWAENQLKRGKITRLQMTGSDAKAINIKTHIEGLKTILDILKQENRILINNYNSHDGNKIKLSKKENIGLGQSGFKRYER